MVFKSSMVRLHHFLHIGDRTCILSSCVYIFPTDEDVNVAFQLRCCCYTSREGWLDATVRCIRDHECRALQASGLWCERYMALRWLCSRWLHTFLRSQRHGVPPPTRPDTSAKFRRIMSQHHKARIYSHCIIEQTFGGYDSV